MTLALRADGAPTLTEGGTLDLGTFTLTEDEIIAFAREWDPMPMHVDPAFAGTTQFGGLIASAPHTFVLVTRAISRGFATVYPVIAGRGFERMIVRNPVRPDVTCAVELTLVKLVPHREGRAHATIEVVATAADGKEVMRLLGELLVAVD